MSDIIICALIAAWWTFSVVVFVVLRDDAATPRDSLSAAVFWPLLVPFGIIVTLWRMPFKSARSIRADLRNRKLLNEFNAWVKRRDAE